MIYFMTFFFFVISALLATASMVLLFFSLRLIRKIRRTNAESARIRAEYKRRLSTVAGQTHAG